MDISDRVWGIIDDRPAWGMLWGILADAIIPPPASLRERWGMTQTAPGTWSWDGGSEVQILSWDDPLLHGLDYVVAVDADSPERHALLMEQRRRLGERRVIIAHR